MPVCGEAEEATIMFIMDKYGETIGHADAASVASSSSSVEDTVPDSLAYEALSNVLHISKRQIYKAFEKLTLNGQIKRFK